MTREEALSRLRGAAASLSPFPIRAIALFGSVARDEATPESDVDVLLEFSAPVGLLEFVRLKRRLEVILGTRVDLVTPAGLREDVREQVLRECVRAA